MASSFLFISVGVNVVVAPILVVVVATGRVAIIVFSFALVIHVVVPAVMPITHACGLKVRCAQKLGLSNSSPARHAHRQRDGQSVGCNDDDCRVHADLRVHAVEHAMLNGKGTPRGSEWRRKRKCAWSLVSRARLHGQGALSRRTCFTHRQHEY